jgi:hypothetical protein
MGNADGGIGANLGQGAPEVGDIDGVGYTQRVRCKPAT